MSYDHWKTTEPDDGTEPPIESEEEEHEPHLMLGTHRINCPPEYMTALGLVNGQAIDHETVNDMNKLSDAAFDLTLRTIGKGIDRLRDSHDELLTAARAIYQSVHGDTIAVGPLWGRLHKAIARAEELAP